MEGEYAGLGGDWQEAAPSSCWKISLSKNESTAHQHCQTNAQRGKRGQSLKRSAKAALTTFFFSFPLFQR